MGEPVECELLERALSARELSQEVVRVGDAQTKRFVQCAFDPDLADDRRCVLKSASDPGDRMTPSLVTSKGPRWMDRWTLIPGFAERRA